MRKQIFALISRARPGDRPSTAYNWFIMAVAIFSVVPMTMREMHPVLQFWIEVPTVYILFFDYLLRWMTYDYKCDCHTAGAFVRYPFTPLALMDIFGLLPSLGLLPASFRVLRLLRLGKLLQYSKSCRRIVNVFRRQSKTLCSVLIIAVAYIFISALVMFVSEPAENFPTFFDALYWATTALTTVGYGDIYPYTEVGKVVSMLSSLFGVAVIAMPAGVVTAGFMEELSAEQKEEEGQDE